VGLVSVLATFESFIVTSGCGAGTIWTVLELSVASPTLNFMFKSPSD